MAQKQTKKESSTAVAVKAANAGAVAIPNYGKEMVGAGWENTDQADFQIPFLNQLQGLSPQCVDGDERQIEGAKPGMFYNSVTGELIDGEVTFLIALTKHNYVEWKTEAQGGGFVGEHDLESDFVRKVKESAKNPMELVTPTGTEIQETFTVYGLILSGADATEVKEQVCISFTRTKIKRYKTLMTRLRTFKGSDKIPLFAHRLVMSATTETNASKKVYKNVDIKPAVNNDVGQSLLPGDSPLLAEADALRIAVTGGAAKANYDSAQATSGKGKDEAADEVFK